MSGEPAGMKELPFTQEGQKRVKAILEKMQELSSTKPKTSSEVITDPPENDPKPKRKV
jgi:hypothetical protein